MTPYVAQCLAIPKGQANPHAATLVGQAANLDELENLARDSLSGMGHTLVALENTTTAQDHLRQHGETELIAALLSSLSDSTPVQISRFFAISGKTPAVHSAPLLTREDHAFEPIDPNDKAPFWDRPWCPTDLRPLLFDGPRRCFMVIDAAKRSELRGGFDIDALEMICECECLYIGAAAEDMREVAPYLLDITPFGAEGAFIPAPLRDLFSTQWDGGSTLFLRTDADIKTLHRHLRHFLRIRSSEGANTWSFFRFWDPNVAQTYFTGIASRADRVDRIFRITPQLPLEIVTGTSGKAIHFFPAKERGPSQARASITFDAHDHNLMQDVANDAFKTETTLWLKEAYPDHFVQFDAAQMDTAVAHIMTQGARVGCVLKDDYAYLAHMMTTLGGWFHVSGQPAVLCKLLREPEGSLRLSMARAFLPAWQDSPQAKLMQNWGEVKDHINALPTSAQITPQAFTNFAFMFFGANTQSIDATLASTKGDLATLDLPQADQGRLLILTLIYGYRFYADPFRPWASLSPQEAVAAAWAECFG